MCWPFVSLWAEFSFAFCAVRERRDRMAEQTLIAFFALSSTAFHELCVPEASGPQRERGGGESSSMRLVLDLSSIFCFICVLCASLRLSSTRQACFTAVALLHRIHSIVFSHWQYWSKKNESDIRVNILSNLKNIISVYHELAIGNCYHSYYIH